VGCRIKPPACVSHPSIIGVDIFKATHLPSIAAIGRVSAINQGGHLERETHNLSIAAIGQVSAINQGGHLEEKLTTYRSQPSGECQPSIRA